MKSSEFKKAVAEIDYEIMQERTMRTYQSFFMFYKDNPHMQSLMKDWNEKHNGDPYIEYGNPILDKYKEQAEAEYRESKDKLLSKLRETQDDLKQCEQQLTKT